MIFTKSSLVSSLKRLGVEPLAPEPEDAPMAPLNADVFMEPSIRRGRPRLYQRVHTDSPEGVHHQRQAGKPAPNRRHALVRAAGLRRRVPRGSARAGAERRSLPMSRK